MDVLIFTPGVCTPGVCMHACSGIYTWCIYAWCVHADMHLVAPFAFGTAFSVTCATTLVAAVRRGVGGFSWI